MKKILLIGWVIFWIAFPLVLGLSQEQDLISVDFRDIEIGDALRLLAKQYNLNIILSKDITGVVTIQFSNVTVEEAIDSIVTTNGFAYTKLGTVYKITRPDVAEPSIRTFRLNNASAKVLKEALKPFLSAVGNIEMDERSNSLIIKDLPSKMAEIQRLIKIEENKEGLDTVTPQVMIEAKIIETVLGTSDKLGIDWGIKATIQGAKRPTTAPFLGEAGTTNIPGIDRFLPLSKPEVSGTVGDFPSVGSGPPLTGHTTGFPYALVPGSTAATALGNFAFGTLDFSTFQAVLELLKSRTNTNLLSDPRITTLNNREAYIQVGDVINVPTFERNATTGNFEITGYTPQPIGIILKVTPRVNAENKITLDLKPEVSSVGATFDDFGNGIKAPRITTRTANTTVQINDGETVVIGGLITEKNVSYVKRVPILGYIPIIGFPFQKTEITKDKTELLIFVTAHILNNKKKADLTYSAMVDTKRKDIFKQDMQDYLEDNKKPLKVKLRKESEGTVIKSKAYKGTK